jgi:hypothetical protein
MLKFAIPKLSGAARTLRRTDALKRSWVHGFSKCQAAARGSPFWGAHVRSDRMLHEVCGCNPKLDRIMHRTTIKGDYGLGRWEKPVKSATWSRLQVPAVSRQSLRPQRHIERTLTPPMHRAAGCDFSTVYQKASLRSRDPQRPHPGHLQSASMSGADSDRHAEASSS